MAIYQASGTPSSQFVGTFTICQRSSLLDLQAASLRDIVITTAMRLRPCFTICEAGSLIDIAITKFMGLRPCFTAFEGTSTLVDVTRLTLPQAGSLIVSI